jgi:alpha,alpha-trehalase
MNRKGILFMLLFGALLISQCGKTPEVAVTADSFYETELFKAVQMEGLFPDSKTFVDLDRDLPFAELERQYLEDRGRAGFDLEEFVAEHFSDPFGGSSAYVSDQSLDMYSHIRATWPVLMRVRDTLNPHSSRIPLPYPYIVPGGRFKEIYYWDSYFTMIGLLADGRMDIASDMLANFGHLIDSLGFIPNGTRDYYLTRSQPPFFAMMVSLLAERDSSFQTRYFTQIEKEYQYWMEGEDLLAPGGATKRVAKIGEDWVMNRYWDSAETPRPESYREDIHLAEGLEGEESKRELYKNLRAAASSGWDFSSRWYAREGEFASTQTTHVLPLDLNVLLYFMEMQLAAGYSRQGEQEAATRMQNRAASRKKAINTLMWDPGEGFYKDFNFVSNSRCGEATLAGVFPLAFGLATTEQAQKVRDRLMADFLKPGGLVTTLRVTGQQWDAPNGWAPLQWMGVQGLLRYGFEEEAREIMQRWLALNERVYLEEGKMMEKYNVVDINLASGGGEYPTQDGFGWTNGVALGFRDLLERMAQ